MDDPTKKKKKKIHTVKVNTERISFFRVKIIASYARLVIKECKN